MRSLVALLAIGVQLLVMLGPRDLVLCIHDGGHVSIEVAGSTCCLTQDFGAVRCESGDAASDLSELVQADDCTDVALGLAVAKSLPNSIVWARFLEPTTSVGGLVVEALLERPVATIGFLGRLQRGDPTSRVRDLATVVLRC